MNNLTIREIDNEWFAVFINGDQRLQTNHLDSLVKLIGIKRLEGYKVNYE
jgi:hypothetical protein